MNPYVTVDADAQKSRNELLFDDILLNKVNIKKFKSSYIIYSK